MATSIGTTGNAALVRAAFSPWEHGDNGPLLDIVADDVNWRIIGSTPVSGIHPSKEAYSRATAKLGARFVRPLAAKVRSVHECGDIVFVQWEGASQSINGRPYVQEYCWVMRMVGGKIVDVVVYLDTALVEAMFLEPAGDSP